MRKDKTVFGDIQKFLQDIENDITEQVKQSLEQEDNDETMQFLDSESEELLREILENDKNFPEVLERKFDDLDYEADERLRAKISVLIKGGYISKLGWGDDVPMTGRIEQKGRSYFEIKANEVTKDFRPWERILYNIIEAEKRGQVYTQAHGTGRELEHLIKIKRFATGIDVSDMSNHEAKYIEIKSTVAGQDYIFDKLNGTAQVAGGSMKDYEKLLQKLLTLKVEQAQVRPSNLAFGCQCVFLPQTDEESSALNKLNELENKILTAWASRYCTHDINSDVSNCPLCALGHEATNKKIWDLKDMDADHVAAWSNGGATNATNCQMLCKTHNRAKGNS